MVNGQSAACALAAGSGKGSRAGWRRRWALPVALLVSIGLAACGGGGGDAPVSAGVLKVTVSDAFGTSVAGASVKGPFSTLQTDAQGVALLLVDGAASDATVTISDPSFVAQSVVAPLSGGTGQIVITLVRATSAAGGSLASRGAFPSSVNGSAQEMTFEIELVVVDGDSRPIENLQPTDFTLRPCTPDIANDKFDCVRGASAVADVAYAPSVATPSVMEKVAGGTAKPYAAAMLLDQSSSIIQSDPSGARLFSAKAFIGTLGANDRILLAAFAGGPGARITTPPLAVYGTFKAQATAPSYFATLDSLASLVGGSTPLYASIDSLRQRVVSDVTLPVALAKAMVVFTDGADTSCTSLENCRATRALTIQQANADQVRLFTIGLSGGVDVAALGELANQTGGAFLYAETAEQLLPLYGSLGRLLSLSLPTYRLRWTVQAGAANAFQSGSTLLGRVQVSAAGKTFDVPFVVGIP
jgi:hypothetical protein